MVDKRKRLASLLAAAGLIVALVMPQMIWAAEAEAEPQAENSTAADTATDGATTPEATPTPDPGFPVVTNDIEGWPEAPELGATTACLLDADTGVILCDRGMTEQRTPASITKIVTCLLALENCSLDETVTFTETGVSEAYSGSSNLYTQVGETFTLEECLYALMLKSANDFASQIAEHVGGSVEQFVQMMNDKAAELGCVNTQFHNAHGLPDDEHWTCAYDMALISQEAIKNEKFREIVGTKVYTLPATSLTAERSFQNHNALLFEGDYYYPNCIGGKTGYTDKAMNTFVGFAEKDGRQLVAVVLGCKGSPQSFLDTIHLFDYGFDQFQTVQMTDEADTLTGGWVTIPASATVEDVVETEGGTFASDFGAMIEKNYSYHEYTVGEAAVTQESVERLEAEQQQAAAADQQELASNQTQGLDQSQELEQTTPEPLSQRLLTTPYIVMGVLLLLILVGLISIIVTLIKRGK